MPYLKQFERTILQTIQPATAAQLCYEFCVGVVAGVPAENYRAVFDSYIAGFPKEEVTYKTYAEVMGAVLGTLSELARRNLDYDRKPLQDAFARWYHEVVGPFEDTKIEQNGDVFP